MCGGGKVPPAFFSGGGGGQGEPSHRLQLLWQELWENLKLGKQVLLGSVPSPARKFHGDPVQAPSRLGMEHMATAQNTE